MGLNFSLLDQILNMMHMTNRCRLTHDDNKGDRKINQEYRRESQECIEPTYVVFSYTLGGPRTMMIILQNTQVTIPTVIT